MVADSVGIEEGVRTLEMTPEKETRTRIQQRRECDQRRTKVKVMRL